MGSYDGETCTYHATSVHRTEEDCPWCPGWGAQQEDQRYQQLAEVTKDATLALQMIETVAHDTIAERLSHAALLDIQEALEELGVSVDD